MGTQKAWDDKGMEAVLASPTAYVAQASPKRIDFEGPVAGTVHRFCCRSMGPPPGTEQKVR